MSDLDEIQQEWAEADARPNPENLPESVLITERKLLSRNMRLDRQILKDQLKQMARGCNNIHEMETYLAAHARLARMQMANMIRLSWVNFELKKRCIVDFAMGWIPELPTDTWKEEYYTEQDRRAYFEDFGEAFWQIAEAAWGHFSYADNVLHAMKEKDGKNSAWDKYRKEALIPNRNKSLQFMFTWLALKRDILGGDEQEEKNWLRRKQALAKDDTIMLS